MNGQTDLRMSSSGRPEGLPATCAPILEIPNTDEQLRLELLSGHDSGWRERVHRLRDERVALDEMRARIQRVAQSRTYCGPSGEWLHIELVSWPVIVACNGRVGLVMQFFAGVRQRMAMMVRSWWHQAYASEALVDVVPSCTVPLVEAAAMATPVRLQSRLYAAESALRASASPIALDALRKDHANSRLMGGAITAVFLPSAFLVRRAGAPWQPRPSVGALRRQQLASLLAALTAHQSAVPRAYALAPMPFFEAVNISRCAQIKHCVTWARVQGGHCTVELVEGDAMAGSTSSLGVRHEGKGSADQEYRWEFDPTWVTAAQQASMLDAADSSSKPHAARGHGGDLSFLAPRWVTTALH